MARKKLNAFGMASPAKHVRLYHWMLACEAWGALTVAARALLIEVSNRHNGQNNGRISMSVREAAGLLNVGVNLPTKLFRELVDKGFLKSGRRGAFNVKGGMASEWEITTEPCNGNHATKEFMAWRPRKSKIAVTLSVTTGHSQRDRGTHEQVPKQARGHSERDWLALGGAVHGHA